MAATPGEPVVIYTGTIVQPVTTLKGERTIIIHEDAALGVDANGFISFFHTLSENAATDDEKQQQRGCLTRWLSRLRKGGAGGRVIALPETQFFMPGFIDCHHHAPQFAYTGTATDIPLMQWLEKYTFPSESRLKDPTAARQVYTRTVRCGLDQGTTTTCYFATIDLSSTKILADLCISMGQRALIGKVSMDRHAPEFYCETTEGSLCDTEEFIKYVHSLDSALVKPVITPRFVPTCSEELLSGLGKLAAKYDVHVQSHISESADQVEFSASLAHLHDNTSRDIAIFDRCGLLTNKTILAHGVHINPQEFQTLKDKGSAIAHCPLSNFFYAHGVFPTKSALDSGVKVGLGTDVAGGYSPAMLTSVRTAVIASRALEDGVDKYRHGDDKEGEGAMDGDGDDDDDDDDNEKSPRVSWKEATWIATMGGAQGLGLDHLIGSFATGKAFDALLIDVTGGAGSATTTTVGGLAYFEETDSVEDMVQKFINTGDDRHIAKVFVQGRQVKPSTLHS